MENKINEEFEKCFCKQKEENYLKLIQLANFSDKEILDNTDKIITDVALTKVLKLGTASEVKDALKFYIGFLQSENELNKISLQKQILTTMIKTQVR